jgi:dihydroorotate dehydrogenase electron transfer subunit
MQQFTTDIIRNRKIGHDFFEMQVVWPEAAGAPEAGHFITIRVSQSTVPLLRRPFAISGFDAASGVASIIYQKRGEATQVLAGKSAGENLDIIGPLGTTFRLPAAKTHCVLVAGGIGLGPMLFLGRSLLDRGYPLHFILGLRSANLLPAMDIFKPITPLICTDDGSAGFAGTAVDCVRTLAIGPSEAVEFFGCGPTPMLKALHGLAELQGFPCQVSMEQVMACGVGACMGCVIKTTKGFSRVCAEGPVFSSRDIIWT